MNNKIKSIEIFFDDHVTLSEDLEYILIQTVEQIVKNYNKENIENFMWLSGYGSKPIWNEPNEPDFDRKTIEITCSVSEDEKGLNRNNPYSQKIRKEYKENRIRLQLGYGN